MLNVAAAKQTWIVGLFLTGRSLRHGNKGTIIMTIVMMALIFINLIFLTAIINGLTATAHRQIIETLNGEVLVEAPSGETPYLDDLAATEQALAVLPDVRQLSSRYNFSAELAHASTQGSYRGVAVDPLAEARVTTVADQIVAGRWLRPDDTATVVLGAQVAGGENLELEAYSLHGVTVGETITLKLVDGSEREYEVVGIFDTDFVQADNRFFISRNQYDSLFPAHHNAASEIAIQLNPGADGEHTADQIERLGISDNVRTWQETAGMVESFTKSFDIVNFIVSVLAIVVAGTTIFIVMYVDVINRRRQIGILRAIGIREPAIALSYLLRALVYAISGVVIGFLLFKFAVVPLFVRRPLHLPVGNVSLVIDNSIMYIRALALMLVSFLGAYIPIQRTLRMHIINAIWGE